MTTKENEQKIHHPQSRPSIPVQINHENNLLPSSFGKCLLTQLGLRENGSPVSVILKDNTVTISTCKTEEQNSVPLYHFPECPIIQVTEGDKNSLKIAVCVLVSRTNSVTGQEEVLLTRRASHMRTFPGVWVVPGGHVEFGENFSRAAQREIHEEVGILIDEGSLYPLIAFESVYPIQSTPTKAHHLVVYMNGRIKQGNETELKLDGSEVGAAAWLDSSLIESALRTDQKINHPFTGWITESQQPEKNLYSSRTHTFNISQLQFIPLPSGAYPEERLSTATVYTLKTWLNRKGNL